MKRGTYLTGITITCLVRNMVPTPAVMLSVVRCGLARTRPKLSAAEYTSISMVNSKAVGGRNRVVMMPSITSPREAKPKWSHLEVTPVISGNTQEGLWIQ